MSGETEENVSGWTTDTLHTHVMRQLDLLREDLKNRTAAEIRAHDLAFAAQSTAMKAALASAEKAVDAALAAQKEAVSVAQVVAEKRADIQNEWRASLNDVLSRAMPRAEAEAVIARATERIQEMGLVLAQTINRAELETMRQREAERYTELATRVTTAEALARGAQANKSGLYAALGVGVTLIIAAIAVFNFISARG